jgi:hypothetical protein
MGVPSAAAFARLPVNTERSNMSRLVDLINQKPMTPDEVRRLWHGRHEVHQPAHRKPGNKRPVETSLLDAETKIEKGAKNS